MAPRSLPPRKPDARATRRDRATVALYFVLYLAPISAGVMLDPTRFYWIPSGIALAMAVAWLRRRGAATAAAVAVNSLSALGNVALLVSLYIQRTGFNAQFFYHIDWTTFVVVFRTSAWLCLVTASYWLLVSLWPRLLPVAAITGRKPRRHLVAALLGTALAMNAAVLSLGWHVVDGLVTANRILLVPKPVRPAVFQGIDNPRDLVVIVAESLEATYSRTDLVGSDLTPALSALAGESLDFTDMRQVSHTGWTTGALVASLCAESLVPQAYRDMFQGRTDARMPGATCLGDVLAAEGYRLAFMVGHSLAFADVGDFLAAHGFADALGLEALGRKIADPAYRSGWGLYDDSVLKLARTKLRELAAGPRPFALVVLTMDTHFPRSHPSRSCGEPPVHGRRPFVLRCADKMLAAFVAEVRSTLPNGVVVLYSDHLARDGLRPELLRVPDGPGPEADATVRLNDSRQVIGLTTDHGHPGNRRLRFTIWDPTRPAARVDRPGTHFDIMPTILDVLGFDAWTEHALGTSLLRFESPWLAHPNPDALQIVRFLPELALRPGDSVSFSARGPVVNIGGRRLLATGRGLDLKEAAFAVVFDPHGRPVRILHAADIEAALEQPSAMLLVGVSRAPAVNAILPDVAGAPLAFFAGVPNGGLVAGPLTDDATFRTVEVPFRRHADGK